jgi:hypothetical protein
MNKIVYIAHPIGGDVQGNVKKLQKIYREISLNETMVTPFIPYIASVQSLDDSNPAERNIGFEHNYSLFDRKVIDEVWLYGPHISAGMQIEIQWAINRGIPVISKTEGTKL